MRKRLKGIDFYRTRRLYYIASAVIIAAGLISLALPGYGLRLGIDFRGGSLLEAKFERTDVSTAEVRTALGPLGLGEPIVQRSVDDPGLFLIRTKAFDEAQRQSVQTTLATVVGEFEVIRFEGISPVIGRELSNKALFAVGIASVLMLLYITVRFEFRFAVAAIVALLHDVGVTVAVFSLLRREINGPFVAALLTVVGYSINDTIVIFDRIRENLRARAHGPGDFGPLINRSISETMTRSINTSVTTLLAILAVFIFGGRTTRDFALALIIGVLTGAYSSIFIASPIWASWRELTLRTAARQAGTETTPRERPAARFPATATRSEATAQASRTGGPLPATPASRSAGGVPAAPAGRREQAARDARRPGAKGKASPARVKSRRKRKRR